MEHLSWIKLFRTIVTSVLFDSAKLLKVWLWCLCKAGTKDRDIMLNNTIVHVKASQFIFGRHTASDALKMPGSTVWYQMQALANLGCIRIESFSSYSLITVVNWAKYQSDPSRDNWIVLSRDILDSYIFENENLLRLWIWLLCKASYYEHMVQIGLQKITLAPGQIVFKQSSVARALDLPVSTVNDYIKKLKKHGSIDMKSGNKYSIVTLLNWASIQYIPSSDGQQLQQQIDSLLTANRQPFNTKKNDIKRKKGENYSLKESEKRRAIIAQKSKHVLEEMDCLDISPGGACDCASEFKKVKN